MAESSKTSGKVDAIISQLHMECSADRAQLERDLFTLKLSKIKEIAKLLKVKVGSCTKAELVGRLLSHWQLGIFNITEEVDISVSAVTPSISEQLNQLPPFESIKDWNKTLDSLSSFKHVYGFVRLPD